MLDNRSMPRAVVIPVLEVADVVRAVGWLHETFGFTERWRAGGHRAQLAVGDGAVVVTEPARADAVAAATVMVRVEDVDRLHDRCREHGARVVGPPADQPYGERQFSVDDPDGHRWTFSQSIADVAPEEWGGESA